MPKRSNSSTTSSSRKPRLSRPFTEENEVDNDLLGLSQNQFQHPVQFSQQIPDTANEHPATNISKTSINNFSSIPDITKEKLITLLSRHMLFQAFAGEPLDRLKLTKEAWLGQNMQTLPRNISNVVLSEACKRIKDVWGVEVRKIPKFMECMKSLPSKYKERLFVVNDVKDDDRGSHSKLLHSVHLEEAVEKGLLMLILAFVYCKGDLKDRIRWLSASVLYRLLNSVDNYIPGEPPSETGGKGSKRIVSENGSPRRSRRRTNEDVSLVALTPDVDALLEKFVQMDYLLKKKVEKNPRDGQVIDDSDGIYYAMGPRAAMEVGRKQIVCFCAEILDEQPDVTMLKDIEDDGDGEEVLSDDDNDVERD